MAFVPDHELKPRPRRFSDAPLHEVKSVLSRRVSTAFSQLPDGVPRLEPLKDSSWRRSLLDGKIRQQLLNLLARTLIFAGTTERFRQAIIQKVQPVEYEAGQVLYHQGDEGDWMVIVMSGKLERKLERANNTRIGAVGPGGIVGDLGMFGVSTVRHFTVTALTDVAVLLLTAEKFDEAVLGSGGEKSLALFRDSAEMQNLMNDVESFVNLRCFRDMEREFVLNLHKNSEPRLCYPNEILMEEGQFGEEMYILLSGTLKIERDDRFVAEMREGFVVGELAVLGPDKRRMATVIVTSLSFVRVVHKTVFDRTLDSFPTAKRTFEHSFIARSAAIQVGRMQQEKEELDAFYGTAKPRRKAELEAMLGVDHAFGAADLRRKALQAKKHEKPVLPKLVLQNGRVQNMTPRVHTA